MASKHIKIGSSGLMKSMNKRIILDMLLNNENVSRTMLSEASGLAMPTVMRIVEGFMEDKLVEEVGKGDSNGGRKPVILTVNPNTYYFLGTDVSRVCRSVVANIRGEIVSKSQCVMDFQQEEKKIMEQVRQNMCNAIEKSGVDSNKIVYSGVGLPGIGFKFMQNSNSFFSFWSDKSREKIEQQLQIGYPTVIENLGRLGAVAELKFGIGRHLKNFLYIYADEGVGMGVVTNGKLETGYHGVGSEFGHTTINFSGQQCYCGNRGCIETYCSSQALLREYKTQLLSEGLLNKGKNSLQLYDLFYAIDGGDILANKAVWQAGSTLGIGIGNMINIFNPKAVIMGGELCQTLPSYMQAAEEEARRHIFINEARQVKFYEASIQWNAEALGAVALAIDCFFTNYCKE